MPEIASPATMFFNAVYSLCTLYMMAILLRWFSPWLNLDLQRPALRWIARITDPLLAAMRKLLPPLGPMDWSPVAALAAVLLVRVLITSH